MPILLHLAWLMIWYSSNPDSKNGYCPRNPILFPMFKHVFDLMNSQKKYIKFIVFITTLSSCISIQYEPTTIATNPIENMCPLSNKLSQTFPLPHGQPGTKTRILQTSAAVFSASGVEFQ